MVVASVPARLPGLQFTTLAAPLNTVLPRMDIGVFVGFAASGPINVPVVVEDPEQFAALFGEDVLLAWDEERREQVYAHLAPAVRAFFRNGGQRCWVIRVAGSMARRNAFPISGLVNVSPTEARPAFVYARSVGSWADDLAVAGGVTVRPLSFVSVDLRHLVFRVDATIGKDLTAGDLLRMQFPSAGYALLVTVAAADARADGTLQVTGTRGVWLSQSMPTASPPPGAPVARILGPDAGSDSAPIRVLNPPNGWSTSDPTRYVLDLNLPPESAPALGALLQVSVGSQRLLVVVDQVTQLATVGSPPSGGVEAGGAGAWLMPSPPAVLPDWRGSDVAEILNLELSARSGTADPVRLGSLGFQPEHPTSWWSLPTDEELYFTSGGQASGSPSALWRQVATPRFPLAGPRPVATVGQMTTIPLGLPFAALSFNPSLPAPDLPLVRDGLATFGPELFIDPALGDASPSELPAAAFAIRFGLPRSRALSGLHAALDVDEATLIAVPDAIHRSWQQRTPTPAPPPRPSPAAAGPAWATFLPTGTRQLLPPTLSSGAADENGTFTVSWVVATTPGADFALQEARQSDFSDAVQIYAGPEVRRSLYGRSPGAYYYRVRLRAGINSSDWSNPVLVQIAPPADWLVGGSDTYDSGALIAVQRALVNLCAARGDLMAVLSLPSHFQVQDAINHVGHLRAALGDNRVQSYAAIYHPWPLGREEPDASSPIRRTPPDGAMCGCNALRAIARGAWVAPANAPLQGIVALEPPIDAGSLVGSGVNALVQRPRGFMPVEADTLTTDPDTRQINVRRLLILLRRLAIRYATTYLFEPHSDSLRRRVQHGFEALLDNLLSQGAFAGADSRTAYQVHVDSAQKASSSVDSGQMVVELMVAAAMPMRLLTIRLVQTGDQTLVTEVP